MHGKIRSIGCVPWAMRLPPDHRNPSSCRASVTLCQCQPGTLDGPFSARGLQKSETASRRLREGLRLGPSCLSGVKQVGTLQRFGADENEALPSPLMKGAKY